MEIYLLRHGIAENGRPGLKDSDRALTGEGRQKLKLVLTRAHGAGVKPSLILSSPLRRAMETAEIAASSLGYKGKIVHTPALMPDASPSQLWEELRTRQDEKAVLLATHEPLTSAAIAFLLNAPTLQVEMKKAGLVRIDCNRLGVEPRGVLKWYLTPATTGE
ncbi:MAG TPA: histidine phosphatase family protein [Bryobacteraceae bacterium]|jgi:phosphohistidine phosphatase